MNRLQWDGYINIYIIHAPRAAVNISPLDQKSKIYFNIYPHACAQSQHQSEILMYSTLFHSNDGIVYTVYMLI